MKKARFFPGPGPRPRLPEALLPEGPGVSEAVEVWISPLHPWAEGHGLGRARLKAEVELRLALAGVPLSDGPPAGGARPPCLGVLLHLNQVDRLGLAYVFSLEMFFLRPASPVGPRPAGSLRMVWAKEAIGDLRETCQGLDWTTLDQALDLLVQEFAGHYLLLPPRPGSVAIH